MRTLFNAHYSVPASPVYYPSAGMIAWSVRISGLIRNRWFLVASESWHRREVISGAIINRRIHALQSLAVSDKY